MLFLVSDQYEISVSPSIRSAGARYRAWAGAMMLKLLSESKKKPSKNDRKSWAGAV